MLDGQAYGFGKGINGQLGYMPTTAKLGLPGTPIAIPTGNALGKKLYGGTFSQTAFIRADNKTCYAMGANTNGQVRFYLIFTYSLEMAQLVPTIIYQHYSSYLTHLQPIR